MFVMLIMFAAICTLSYLALRPALKEYPPFGIGKQQDKSGFAPL